ncbi:hypothetical protein ACFLR0_00440 [Candidatus Bipolaricaulota bacterium]
MFPLWLGLFAFVLLVGLLIQLVVLPHVLPSFHAGDGLFVGGDWITFHREAVDMSTLIRNEGWDHWEFAQEGQSIVGIIAAIYAVTVPRPWVLLPIQAALHATATLALIFILNGLVESRNRAVLVSLLFFLMPSALIGSLQILKDIFSVPGFLLYLAGWVALSRSTGRTSQVARAALLAVGLGIVGSALMWCVRAYLLQILQMISGVGGAGLTVWLIVRAIRRRIAWRSALLVSACSVLLVLQLSGWCSLGGNLVTLPEATQDAPGSASGASAEAIDGQGFYWVESTILPGAADQALRKLAEQRDRWNRLNPGERANIDEGVVFHSAVDVVRYAPRALQIALFAPFPTSWFSTHESTFVTLHYWLVGVEMIIAYLGLLLIPLGVIRWWRSPALWVVLLFCLSMLLAWAFSTINAGTLYRLRYPYLLTLVCLGMAGGTGWIRRPPNRQSSRPKA